MLKNKPSLHYYITKEQTLKKKIEGCIKYAIEYDGLETETDVKEYVKKVITELGLFQNPKTRDNRFDQEWGKARKSLINEGIISRSVKFYLVKEPIPSEIQNILRQLKKTDKLLAIQNGLQRLCKISPQYNIAVYPGVLDSLFKIITSDELFYVKER
ncbi:hypothetical protein ACFL0D_02425 [Thermoproteota archaeon]